MRDVDYLFSVLLILLCLGALAFFVLFSFAF